VNHELAHGLEAFAAAFAVFLVLRLALRLRQKERELEVQAAARARGERFTAIATLAAGAAHELATPLSTLAVVAKDLAERAPKDSDVAKDAEVIRAQVERCRRILQKLTVDGDEARLARAPVEASALIAALRDSVGEAAGARDVSVAFHTEPGAEVVMVPLALVLEAATPVLHNAVAAARSRVDIVIASGDDGVHIVVADDGPGIAAPDTIGGRHIGEPFVTTKPGGTGLGLFLARVICERLGGELVIDAGDSGTTVLLHVPHASLGDRAAHMSGTA